MSDLVSQTHEAVWQAVQKRLFNVGSLMFFTADTGLGKTTGFRKAIVKLWEKHPVPVLIMVPTRKDADVMWQEMERLAARRSAVWTSFHDPEDTVTVRTFTPSRYFTKAEAVSYPCLILTHNAGKKAEEWAGRRDLVLVDEDPSPSSPEVFEPYHLVQARDAEARAGLYGDIFAEAATWAEKQQEQGLTPVAIPEWVDKVLHITPITDAGRYVQRLAQGIREGRAFQTRTSAVSWTCYKFDLPYQDRSIIFSATAQLEGWQLGVDHEIEKDGPKVDFSNVVFNWVPWPSGVSKYHRTIIQNREQRETFVEAVAQALTWADEDTLIVCPKDFESDIQHRLNEAKVTHYGCDVGSNEYRNCNRVMLVSEFHKPTEVHRAHYLAHSGVEKVTEDNLRPVSNTKSRTYREVEDNNYAVHLKQMVSRGSLRHVDDSGKAYPCEVFLMIDKERFSRLVPQLFPGAVLLYPEGMEPKTKGFQSTQSVVSKLMQLLPQIPKEHGFVSSVELQRAGIKIKGSDKKRMILEKEDVWKDMGWHFEQGSPGKYSNPSGFRRI